MPHTYLEPTYKEVLCWKADTRIKYAPNPKRGKSFIRYAKYAKAGTVAEALARGSKPQDLFFDYEHGYIGVGGPRRRAPLDPKEECDSWTEVDVMLAKMHRAWLTWRKTFSLAAKLGVDRRQLTAHKVGGESPEVRAGRLAANELAKMVLDDVGRSRRRITERDVVAVLRLWGFRENTSRQNVLPEGENFVFSDTLGLVSNYRGYVSVSSATTEYGPFTRVLTGWLKDHMPADFKRTNKFGFTSINVNANYAGRLHRDANNEGPSLIKAFGGFTGGLLNYWADDDKASGPVEKCCRDQDAAAVDLRRNLLLFDGNRGHGVSRFRGERFSLVYFSIGQYHKANKAVRGELASVGIDVPSRESLGAVKRMLGAPGRVSKAEKARCWPATDNKGALGTDFTSARQVEIAKEAAYRSEASVGECRDTSFVDSKLTYVTLPDGRRGCRVHLVGASGGLRLAVSGDEVKCGAGVYDFKKAEGFPRGPALSTRRLGDVREWVAKVVGKPLAAKAKTCVSSRSADDAAPPSKRRRLSCAADAHVRGGA